MVENRVETHREMARRKYEAQAVGHEVGHIDVWYTPEGPAREPYELTLFSPKRGEWKVSADTMDPNREFQMYWTRIPDFGIKDYEVWPVETGWIARLAYKGTARDGEEIVAHQVDIVTTDDPLFRAYGQIMTAGNGWPLSLSNAVPPSLPSKS